jgi:hypothetical protein
MSQDGPSEDTVLELYKISVEMADRVSARRGTANAFFLSVQTAVISVLGLAEEHQLPGSECREIQGYPRHRKRSPGEDLHGRVGSSQKGPDSAPQEEVRRGF